MTDAGLFTSVMKTAGRPNKAILNALMGNWEGAGRQVLDILGDVADAGLPGDVIPEASREQDSPEFSDVIGGMEPGIAKTVVDIGGGMITDPWMIVPVVGPAIKAAGLAGKAALSGAAKVAPQATKALVEAGKKAGMGVRSMAGAQRVAKPYQELIDKASASGRAEANAGLRAGQTALAGLSEGERQIVSDIVRNELVQGRQVLSLAPEGSDIATRLSLHPGVTPESIQKIQSAAEKTIAIGQSQAGRPNVFWKKANAPDALTGADDAAGELPLEYLPRQYAGVRSDPKMSQLLGRPSSIQEMELKTPEMRSDFLAKNPDVLYERDAAKLLAPRAEQQGSLAKRADIGAGLVEKMKTGELPLPYKDPKEIAKAQELFKRPYAQADAEFRKLASDGIDAIAQADPETGKVLYDNFHGLAQRGELLGLLAKTNTIIKPMMTAGVFLPKLGFNVRNAISGVWQTMSNPATRPQTLSQLKRVAADLGGSISDAVSSTFGLKLPKDAQAASLAAVDDAFATSAGSAANASAKLRAAGLNIEADAIENGVLDGFVSSEELLRTMQGGKFEKLKSVAMWPTKIMQGLESRMRLGLYRELRNAGQDAATAAKNMGDTLFKYDISSGANRTMRDLIPFSQFMAKAIPQQAKFLAEGTLPSRIALSGVSQAYGANESNEIYPWMQGKMNIPLGENEQGDQSYISGFGLPFEALSNLPNPSADPRDFGRQVERNILGSAHPLLKTSFGLVSGEDPYTEQPFLGNDKVPVLGHAGDAGRLYNAMTGAGLTQPIDSPLRQIDKAMDDRRGVGARALDLATGANVVSVDPDRARQMALQEELKSLPAARQYTGFFAEEGDTDTAAQIKALRELGKKVKDKKAVDPASAEPPAPKKTPTYKINRSGDRRVKSVEVDGVTYEIGRGKNGRAETVEQRSGAMATIFKVKRNERGDVDALEPDDKPISVV